MHPTENHYQNASQNPTPAEGTRQKAHYTSFPNRVLDLQAGGRLSVYGISVALWLARYARQKNECFPSVDTLVRDLHVSRASAYKGLRELEAAGLLRTGKRRGRGGNHNVYTLHFWEPLNGTLDDPNKMSPLTKTRANIHNSDVQTSATETLQRPPRGLEVYAGEKQPMNHTEQVKPDANFENHEIRGDSTNTSANAPHDCQSGWVFGADKCGNKAVKPCPHCKAQWEQSTTTTKANASAVSTPDFVVFDWTVGQQEAVLPEIKEQPTSLARGVSSTESVAWARRKARGVVTGEMFNLCWQAFEQCTNIRRTSLDERMKKRMNGMLRHAAFSGGGVSAFQTALDEALKHGGKDQPPLKLLGSLRFAAT